LKRLAIAVILLSLGHQVDGSPRRRAAAPAAPFPPCSIVTGTGAVTFTRDEGRTLAPTAQPLSGIGYTYGLAPLDEPATLLAWHKSDLLISTDNGCSWRVAGSATEWGFPPTITAAKGGRAYIWSDNNRFLLRYDARGLVKLKEPAAFTGLGVDANDADHVRAGSDEGVIWDSRDGGVTWDPIGMLRPDSAPSIFYRFAFSKSDLDHIVAGTTIGGAYVSHDGGRSWTKSAGFGAGGVNAFNLAVSPADDRVVWAIALKMGEGLRHVYRSGDGGATFAPVVDESASVTLINGNVMAAHPVDPDILYFVFGTRFQGYGTDVFRYDAASRELTMTHNAYDDIDSIAFSPSDPKVMYFGLESESGVR
jgi:photosystem II stability/assembly factor-like uncharacterized protein